MFNVRGLAVILVDMQDHFVGMLGADDKECLIRNQTTILKECAEHGVPVVVLEYVGHGKTVYPLAELVAKVPKTVTIAKCCDDGFSGTDLDVHLIGLKAKSVILMGVNASFCVKETAQSAVRLGYQVFTSDRLIADACKCSLCVAAAKSVAWYQDNAHLLPTLSVLPLFS